MLTTGRGYELAGNLGFRRRRFDGVQLETLSAEGQTIVSDRPRDPVCWQMTGSENAETTEM